MENEHKPNHDIKDVEKINKMITGKKVYTKEENRIANDLKTARDKKELETHPHFQRNPGIWRLDKKSLLIESILADIPIPAIYIAEATSTDNRLVDEVVDGQQRLTTIFDFIDGGFALKGLKIYENELEKCQFKDLPVLLQEKILKCSLHLVKIMRTSDPDVEQAMFMRLNQGSVSLNKQEFRECFYYSPLVEFIRELADTPLFKEFMNDAIPDRTKIRRKPEELVAEALAFHVLSDEMYKRKAPFIDLFYAAYKDPVKYVINCSDFEKWHDDFTEACVTIRRIFGKYPFRNLVDKNGYKSPRKFNEGIYRIYMTIFMKFIDHKIARLHADDLLQIFKEKLYKNDEFLFTISAKGNDNLGIHSTADVFKVRKGLDMFRDLVKNACKERIPRLSDREIEQLKQKELDEQERIKNRNLAEWEAKKDG